MESLIAAEKLSAGYGAFAVVRDLDLEVRTGEVVALLGPNGSGKTTTLLTLAGELPPLGGRVLFRGSPTKAPLHDRARRGLAYVTEERSIFMRLSVADNLRVASADQIKAFKLFPELRPLASRKAGLLSGGEQQMLALARALARGPSLLMADELSLGLAPLIVDRLLDAVRSAADKEEVGVLLVEQHVRKVLYYCDRAYVMRRGRIVLEGSAAELRNRLSEIEDSYLSESAAGRRLPMEQSALGDGARSSDVPEWSPASDRPK